MKKIIITIIIILLSAIGNAQTVISGRIFSVISNTPEPYVTVRLMKVDSLIMGTFTDNEGYFTITITSLNIDSAVLVLSKIGYEKTLIPLIISNITKLDGEFILGKKYKEKELLFSVADAERDIANGVIQLYFIGTPILDYMEPKLTNRTKEEKYKVNYVPFDGFVNQKAIQSVELYNNTVKQYLNEKYGKLGWE
jgi:hypothetical protein